MRYLKKKICILLALTLLTLLCACSEHPAQTETPEGSAPQASETESPAAEPTPEPEEAIGEILLPEPTEDGEETAAPEGTEEPVPPAPSEEPLPEETPEPVPTRVEDDFFADAAFFGNSLVDCLRIFGGLEYGTFIAGTSASVLSVETVRDAHLSSGAPATMLDALLEQQYGRIYVLFGINELGFNTGSFVELYEELLGKVAEAEPDAEIIVMSLTPITERRSNSEDLFTRDKVLEFNAAICAMASRHGYGYLDLFTGLSDENGWLPQEQSTDGVHFTADKYLEWAEYLRKNPDGSKISIVFE